MRRVAFLGQKVIAEQCLRLLLAPEWTSCLEVVALVSDDTFAAKFRDSLSADARFIGNAARNEDEIVAAVASLGVDTLISVQHPWILSGGVLDAVNGFAFNLHNAKLPDYRGHNSISHAILDGVSMYTTTIHWIDRRVDLGCIAYEETISVSPEDTAFSLYANAAEASVRNFRKLIEGIASAQIPRIPISGEGRFYRRRDIEPLKRIRSLDDAVEVDRKSRAFYFPPHEPAYIELGGRKYFVSPRPY
jgi:methionyl-tRNA formyltransferase